MNIEKTTLTTDPLDVGSRSDLIIMKILMLGKYNSQLIKKLNVFKEMQPYLDFKWTEGEGWLWEIDKF